MMIQVRERMVLYNLCAEKNLILLPIAFKKVKENPVIVVSFNT